MLYVFQSFYKLMIYLRKNKKEFAIILRAFGNNIDFVKNEINYFVNGKHPLYNGENGTSLIKFDTGKNPRNFNIIDNNLGTYYRQSELYNETTLL